MSGGVEKLLFIVKFWTTGENAVDGRDDLCYNDRRKTFVLFETPAVKLALRTRRLKTGESDDTSKG